MRWSTMHVPTLRDDPADAGAPSHRLLLRAGYIRQLMAGHYSLLPLGQRVRLKVIGIIREEMDRIGAQELLMPVMHPAELWVKSGRWELMGDELFRLKDRKGADFVLGMTHEEIISTLATEMESYRELPQMWYQFQTKMRDEPRPKAGLMRTREFTMKDSYSFDLDAAGLDASFRAHRDAYVRIFERLSVPAVPADASSGAMGGSDSTEFICPSPAGEDLIVLCPECGYAANIEKAASRLAAVDDSERAGLLAAPEPFATPGVRTIEDLTVQYQAPGDRQIKTLVYFLDGVLTLVLLRGDHALNEQKLIDATGTTAIRPAQADEIRDALGALPGSLGAVGVTDHPVIADEALRDETGRGRWAGGPACARSRRATSASTAGTAWKLSAASRSGTSSSSVTSTPTPWTSGCPARTASRLSRSWAATASASSARWPRSSRSTTTTRASSGRPRWLRSRSWW